MQQVLQIMLIMDVTISILCQLNMNKELNNTYLPRAQS